MAEINEGVAVAPEATEEKAPVGGESPSAEDVAKLNETIGSLKRDLKDAKKAANKDSDDETPKKTTTDDSELSEKVELLSLQVAGITKDSEKELARKLQEETGLSMDKLIESKYFKSELEELQTSETNAEATSGVKGDKQGSGNVKQSADYWIAKGEYPTRDQVSDRTVRAEIRKAMVNKESGKGGGQFYNS